MPSSSSSIIVNSKYIIHTDQKSSIDSLQLSVSDLPMLSCQYIQKGVLFNSPPYPINDLVSKLKLSLAITLSQFPALAGRLQTDADGHVHILCNNAGVDFIHTKAKHLTVNGILSPKDVPYCFNDFFAFDRTLSYSGHFKPLVAVQVTELNDGIFIGFSVNHAVVDGTSLWHFFNTFAEIYRGAKKISNAPDFSRDTVFNSTAVLLFPPGGPKVTFSGEESLRERIFHFSREAIQKLKVRANSSYTTKDMLNGVVSETTEIIGKQSNESWKTIENSGKISSVCHNSLENSNNGYNRTTAEISSFQSLCAHLWRSVTRARNLDATKTTTFRMAVNCRHRVAPKMESYYFGNAIQSIPTNTVVGELLSRDLIWCADLLHKNVVAHNDATVRQGVEDWEREPRLFPLGNFDGASITMGSSPRFPMYNNDFGWGKPLAVRSGRANKFDGKISAFPGRDEDRSVDLEVVLAPETMANLETDSEFMQYVSEIVYAN